MATNFPNSPSNGDTHTFGGATYTYNSTIGAWTGPSTTAGGASVTVSETAPSSPSEGDLWFDPSVLKTFVYYNDGTANQWVQSNPTGSGGSGGGGASVTASDTAPTSPSAGDLWFKSDTGALYVYYTDADSSQWVGISGPAGADGAAGTSASVSYANLAAFPASPTEGDIAYAQDTNALYVYDGTTWKRILAGTDAAPAWVESGVYLDRPSTSALKEFNASAANPAIEFTVYATDPDGFPITYDYDVFPTSPNQLTSVTQPSGTSTGTFLVTPNIVSTSDNEGSFKVRVRASDGVRTISDVITFNLQYLPATGFNTLYIAHTSGTIREVVGGTSEANATDITSLVENTVQDGDVVLLNPATGSTFGHFKYTGDAGNNNNIWANKAFALVGGALTPDKIFLWHNHDATTTTRDHPLFISAAASATGTDRYRQFGFNFTYHRHQVASINYSSTLTQTPDNGGGTMLNCILDLNNGNVAWTYDNSNSTASRRSFKHCTFLNYASWQSPYSGSATAVRVIDCAFDSTYHNSATFLGTQGTNVDVDGWTYDTYADAGVDILSNSTDLANGTYGHMKDLNELTSTNVLFDNYQDVNT